MRNNIFKLLFISIIAFACDDPPDLNHCNNNKFDSELEEALDCGGKCEPCNPVIIGNELVIKDTSITNSDIATKGLFSFGELIANLTPEGKVSKDLILSLFKSFDSDQQLNGFTVRARPIMADIFVEEWKRRDGQSGISDEDWVINLNNAPLRLLAITSRIDLNERDSLSAGEGRFTFGQDDNGANDFTLIFEYNLNIASAKETEVIKWAKRWHKLSSFRINTPEYMEVLTEIVTLFTVTDVKLNQIRTNSVIGGPWEFREFNLKDGEFVEVTRKNNPDVSLNNSSKLKDYLSTPEIVDEFNNMNHIVRDSILAGNTQYGISFKWNAEGIDDSILEQLDFISCTGCHGGFDTRNQFTHIRPRSINSEATISPFLIARAEIRKDSITSMLRLSQTEVEAMQQFVNEVDTVELKQQLKLSRLAGIKTIH